MNLRARFAASLGTLLVLFAPTQDATALQTPTPAPCTATFHFASNNYSATEEQGVATLTVQRECTGQAVSVNFASSDGTAITGSDYTGVSGTLNFAANETSKTISVPILNDTVADSGETFFVSLSGSGTTSPYQATVTISDGLPTVSISASPTSGLESDEPTAKFTVSLSEAPSSTVTVPISLAGTATRYGANIITDPSLESSTDRWWLNSENNKGAFTRAGEGAFFGSSGAKFSATTMDGWMIPSYKLDLDISTGGLAIQPYTLSFYARAEATRTLWAHIAGINGLDLMADLGNVTITPTWKRYTLTFTPLHNGAAPSHYPNLRFSAFADDLPLTMYIDGLKLEPGSSASKFGDYEFFGKNLISNSDLESAGTNWSLNSGGGDAAFSRVNTTAYSGTYSAKYSATTFSGWLIPTYNVWSDIHPDGLSTTDQYALSYYAKMDAARTLSGTIGNGNGTGALAYFGEVEFGTTWKRYEYFFTPANNGAAPNYPGIKLEALSNDVPFTLYWDKLQLQKVTPQSSVTFAPGETTKILEMPVIDDRIFEAGETIIVDLGTPVGADRSATQGSATFTINNNDDDLPAASFPTPASSKSEGETASFTVALSHDNTEVNISVPFSYSGTAVRNTDYAAPSNISITSGTISGSLQIDADEDAIDEDNETVIATIGTSSTVTPGSPSAATLTIVDENPAPTVQLSASTATVSEDAQTIQVTAQLSTQSGRTVTVQYATASGTAVSDEDFTLTTGTVTINPGQTAKSFSVPVTIDCKTESSETFSVALSNPSNATLGATTSQTITITDGTPCAKIEVTPAEIVFPDHDISPGPSRTKAVTVFNRGNATLEFAGERLVISGTDSTEFTTFFYGVDTVLTVNDIPFFGNFPSGADSSPIAAGAGRQIQIAFDPRSTGQKGATLSLFTNAVNYPQAVVGLSGTAISLMSERNPAGSGQPPEFDAEMSIRFGTSDIGSSGWINYGLALNKDSYPRTPRLPLPTIPTFAENAFDGLCILNRVDESGSSPPWINSYDGSFGFWTNAEDPARATLLPYVADSIIKVEWQVASKIDPLVSGSAALTAADVPHLRLRLNSGRNNMSHEAVIESKAAFPTLVPVNSEKTFTTFIYADGNSMSPDSLLNPEYDHYYVSFDQLSVVNAGGKKGAATSLRGLTASRISKQDAESRFELVWPNLSSAFLGSAWSASAYEPDDGDPITQPAQIGAAQPGDRYVLTASNVALTGKSHQWGLGIWERQLTSADLNLTAGRLYRMDAFVSTSVPPAYDPTTQQEVASMKIPKFRLRVNFPRSAPAGLLNASDVFSYQPDSNPDVRSQASWSPSASTSSAGTRYVSYFRIPQGFNPATDSMLVSFDMIAGYNAAVTSETEQVGVELRDLKIRRLKDLPAVTGGRVSTGETASDQPTLLFNELNETELMVSSYTVEMSDTPGFSGGYFKTVEIKPRDPVAEYVLSWPELLQTARTYYWRVTARDVFNQESVSQTWHFRTSNPGTLYLATTSSGTDRIYQLNVESSTARQLWTKTDGYEIQAMAVQPATGSLYVLRLQAGNEARIVKINTNGASAGVEEYNREIDDGADSRKESQWLAGIAFGSDGKLYATHAYGMMVKIEVDSGSPLNATVNDLGTWSPWDSNDCDVCKKTFWMYWSESEVFAGGFAWDPSFNVGNADPAAYSISPSMSYPGGTPSWVTVPTTRTGGVLEYRPKANGSPTQWTCFCAPNSYLETKVKTNRSGYLTDNQLDGLLNGNDFLENSLLAAGRDGAGTLRLYVFPEMVSRGSPWYDPNPPSAKKFELPMSAYTGVESAPINLSSAVAVAYDLGSTREPFGQITAPASASRAVLSVQRLGNPAGPEQLLKASLAMVDLEPAPHAFRVKYPVNPPSDAPTLSLIKVSGSSGPAEINVPLTGSSGLYETVVPVDFAALQPALSGPVVYEVHLNGQTNSSGSIRIDVSSPSLSIDSTPQIVR